MNATGESDLVNYIDLLTGLQTNIFEPRLDVFDALVQAHFGIAEYTYEWCDIFPESNVERAKRAVDIATALDLLIANGTITTEAANCIIKHSKVFGECDVGKHNPNPPNMQKGSADNAKPSSTSKSK